VSKIKHSVGSNKILRNVNDKIVNLCELCEQCESGTMGTVYRINIPADTFFGPAGCIAAFNSTTKDLTTGHPFYASACVRALDITPLNESGGACEGLAPDAIVLDFLSLNIFLDFIFGGGFVRFSLPLTAPYNCTTTRTVTYDSTSGSPSIDSSTGKTISITRIS
jgi:hypothetical protein